jgi:hypothetical protein
MDPIIVGPTDDLPAAIAGAPDGAEIVLQAGEYMPVASANNAIEFMNRTLTLRAAVPGSVILHGNNQRRVIDISGGNVQLGGLNITNGSAAESRGGGINLQEGAFADIWSCNIFDCSAFSYGGGVAFYASRARITDTTIARCVSQHGGGGMRIEDSVAALSSVTIVDSSAGSTHGGGIHVLLSSSSVIGDEEALDFRGGQVSRNDAQNGGGGLYVETGAVRLDGVDFVGNSAWAGAAILVQSGLGKARRAAPSPLNPISSHLISSYLIASRLVSFRLIAQTCPDGRRPSTRAPSTTTSPPAARSSCKSTRRST